MMTGLLFLSSCQELDPIVPIPDEAMEISFDRSRFLSAVNKATLDYVSEINSPHRGGNFRTIYDSDAIIHDYINGIASNFNTSEYFFRTIPANT